MFNEIYKIELYRKKVSDSLRFPINGVKKPHTRYSFERKGVVLRTVMTSGKTGVLIM